MSNGAERGAGALHRAVDSFERFFEKGQVWIAIAAGSIVFFLQVPGAHELFTDLGLDDNVEFLTAVAVVLLTSILIELYQLKRSVTPAISIRRHFFDAGEMYDALKEKAGAITDPGHREIKVLGLTLGSAWPILEVFLERPEVEGWTVKLATLSENATAARDWVPGGWPEESKTIVRQVREFKARQGVDHKHKIEIFEYDFTPAVHGFRLGNGDIFLSTLRWRPDGLLGQHRYPYDYVSAHDGSPGAYAVRELFHSWFERAVCSASGASTPKGPTPDASEEPPK
jgi:hypothetical protein